MPSLEIKVTDAQEEELSEKPNKRLFIGLVMGTSALICLILALLWLVPYVGLTTIHPVAPKIFGVLVRSSSFCVVVGPLIPVVEEQTLFSL